MNIWQSVKVAELGRIVTGKTPKTAITENYGGDILFLTPSDDMSVKYVSNTAKTLTERGVSEVKNALLPPDTVCVSCIGSDLGKVVITSKNTVTNQQINSIIVDKKRFDVSFVYYAMLILGKELNFISKTSTAVPIVNKSSFSAYKILCPSLEQQKKIVTILSALDSKIECNKQINDNLQQQAFSVFDNLITNAENNDCTVSDYALLNPKRTLAKKQVARSIDMSQLSTSGAFPSGWEMKPFNGGMRFTNGDTLLARITPCLENGKTAFIDFLDDGEVAFGSTEYIVLAPKNGTPPEMLYCLARHPAFVDYAVKNMNGSSGRQRVSAETVGQYRLPLVDKHCLVLFKEVVSPMFLKMRYNSLENMRLADLRDALLPKLMSGEIDVSEVKL